MVSPAHAMPRRESIDAMRMRSCLVIVVLSLATGSLGCSVPAPTTPGRDAARNADAGTDAVTSVDAGTGDDARAPNDAGLDDADRDAAPLACTGAMVTLPFPAMPDGDDTDPPGCTSCPHFTNVSVSTSGTTATITGTVTGSTTCSWTLVSPSCGGTSGPLGPDPEFGAFSRTIPLFCGNNRLQLVCDGPGGHAVATRTIAGPSCGGRAVQVTLTWGATSNDQELHLVREGFHLNDATNDCTWFTCVHASPDWGTIGDATDDPHKDVDWLQTFGPENVYLERAADGRYEVMVEYWGSGTADTSSITVLLDGTTVWMGSHVLNVHEVWDVGTITFPGRTFTPVDAVIPCESAWRTGGSMGCALPIP